MLELLAWASVGFAAAGLVLLAVLLARRALLARRESARVAAESRLQPWALALLAGPDAEQGELPLSAADRRRLARILARYSKQLGGEQRSAIAAYFERSGDVRAAISALGHHRAWRRAVAAAALGDMGSATAVPALLASLDDDDRDVRIAAARTLGRLGDTRAVEPLVEALARHRLPRDIAAYALLQIGRGALPRLGLLATADDAGVRRTAIDLVGLLGDAADAEAIIERLRDTAAEVRAGAARALGRLGAERGTAALRGALDDRVPFVRAAAATALGVIGDGPSVERLLVLARTDSFDPAYAAARAAVRIEPEAVVAAAGRADASPVLCEVADVFGVA